MQRHPRIILATLTGLVLAIGSLSEAAAQKRVVVLDIEGARTSGLQRSLVGLIGDEHTVIPARKYRRTAMRLRARKLNPRNVAKVSAELQADGVIEGLIVARRGRYLLRLRVREGSTGRTVHKINVRLRRPALSAKLRRALGDRLMAALANVEFNESIDEDAAPRVKRQVDDAFEGDDSDSPRARARTAARIDDASEPEGGSERSTDGSVERSTDSSVERSTAARTKTIGAMKIAAGLSVRSRSLAFTVREGFMEAPQGYTSGMAGGAQVNGELYPLAIDASRKGALRNLGFGFVFDRAVGLETSLIDENDTVTKLPTDHTRYGASIRYKYVFSPGKKGSPSITASVGYNKLRFDIDRSAAPAGVIVDVPDVNYVYIDPGLELRYPLSPKMTIAADAKGMLITSAGAVQSEEEYGTAKVTGIDAGVKLEYLVKPRFVLQIEGRYQAIGYDFEGTGEQTFNRDNDPSTIDIGGALDRYLGGSVTLGYLF